MVQLRTPEGREVSEEDEGGETGVAPAVDALAAASSAVWVLCVGHAENKKRCGVALPQLLELLQVADAKAMAETVEFATMAVWSACYGVEDNQRFVLDHGGVPLLAKLLSDTTLYESITHAACGAMWHLSTLQAARLPLCDAGVMPRLALLSRNAYNQELHVGGSEVALFAALTISFITMEPITLAAAATADALAGVRAFVRGRNFHTYSLHNLVWTSISPLVQLLRSAQQETRELGAFLCACTSRTNEMTSKLFLEGAVGELRCVWRREAGATVEAAEMSAFALNNLGLLKKGAPQPPQQPPQPPPAAKPPSLSDWLASVGLQKIADTLAANGVEDTATLQLLTEADLTSLGLSLGTRRRLGHLLAARQQALQEQQEQQQEQHFGGCCLVCMDAPRSVCFVPCGHVVSCGMCAQILVARGDPCIVCRTPITAVVTPRFV
eukprot:TRINITY_DN3332_c0_g1_i1.p1 TRINITY_DN3332_c0_g1~~TRINITY_DN3332_c0_g1_i1.p1  ORF type:complete len:511 (-),score=153.27 TRINITY_DN3332_c0_g1_i1:26-1345(-)